MKKVLLLLTLLIFGLVGCKTNSNKCECHAVTSEEEQKGIKLNKANFQTYVAINSSCTVDENNWTRTYYSHFIGSNKCTFKGCYVSYRYVYGTTYRGEDTAALSLSGDGQAEPFHIKITNYKENYTIEIVSASGMVYMK